MPIKVFAISASEFVVPGAQPILHQLIKFALLKDIKVRVLINSGDERAAQEALGELKNDERIKLVPPDNSVDKNELSNIAGQEIWAKGANLELLSLLAELSPQNDSVPSSDYPSVLFLTADRDDARAAMDAKFNSVLRPPARPGALLSLGYLQEISAQLGVKEAASTEENPFTDDLKKCAINLINEFNRINGASSTTTNVSGNASLGATGTLRSSAEMDMDADDDKDTEAAAAVPAQSTAATSSSSSSTTTATATTTATVIYSQLPAFAPSIKALAFSYQSIAREIARPINSNQPFLPYLLIELALHLNLTVWIMKSQDTLEDENFETVIKNIRSRMRELKANQLLITDSTQTLAELRWSAHASNAAEVTSLPPANTIYYISSNLNRINSLKRDGFSAIFCQNNPNQELQPLVQALTNIITNPSTSDFIIGQLVGKITLLLNLPSASAARKSILVNNAAATRRVRWPNESEISSTVVQPADNDDDQVARDYDDSRVHELLYSNNQQPVRHSRAWVAGFFGASALGGAAGAGLGEYFIPEDAFNKEIHATLIASASAVGAGLFGLAYWGVTKVAQLCCQATQQSETFNDRSPLLGNNS